MPSNHNNRGQWQFPVVSPSPQQIATDYRFVKTMFVFFTYIHNLHEFSFLSWHKQQSQTCASACIASKNLENEVLYRKSMMPRNKE